MINVLLIRWVYITLITTMILGSLHYVNGAERPNKNIYARCVSSSFIVPCKLTEDGVYINGTKWIALDVIQLNGKLNILVKDNK